MFHNYNSLKDLRLYWYSECQVVYEILKERLSDEPTILEGQMREAESYCARMQVCLAQANSVLDLTEFKSLPTKESGTELDRKIGLASAVREERSFRSAVEGLVKSLSIRINSCQSLLNYHRSLKNI